MNDSDLTYAGPAPLNARDFDRIRKLAQDYCGLSIEVGKEDLVSARLGKVMRAQGLSSFGAYYDYVVGDATSQALVTMIDHLTTNHTSFFREQKHFDFLNNTIFPALSGRSTINVWSAACSSGEEPYSIAFAGMDFFSPGDSRLAILATDISTRVLEVARKATYDASRFEGIPTDKMQRYLLRGTGASSHLYRVKPEIRAAVEFRRLNLVDLSQRIDIKFPLILCRNAMIYFNAATQEQVVHRFYEQLEPGGYLFIGHSENLNRIEHRFQYVCPAVYRRQGTLQRIA